MDVLEEIAYKIFSICEEYESYFSASLEGIWYRPQNLVNPIAWSKEKQEILKCAKLRVAQCSSSTQMTSLKAWRDNDQVGQVFKLKAGSENIVPVWDLIKKSWKDFQRSKKLATAINNGWICFIEKTHHSGIEIPQSAQRIKIPGCGNPWMSFVNEFGMKHYFPCKLPLQSVRLLDVEPKRYVKETDPVTDEKSTEIKELPWRVLKQIMLTNVHCREHDISIFAKSVKPNKGLSKTFG